MSLKEIKMKKIVVVDTAASYGGAMTVLKDFYQAVKRSDRDTEWHFLLSGPYLEEAENIRIHVIPDVKSYPQRIWLDLHRGKKIIEEIEPDLVFSLQNTKIRGLKVPQILYVHQPVPFQNSYNFSFIRKGEFKTAVIQYFLGTIIKDSIRHADKIIVQTKWMKEAVVRLCNVSEDIVYQIYPTAKKIDNKAEYVTTNKFIYPTSVVIYKNISLIDEACLLLDKDGIDYTCQITVDNTPKSKGVIYSGQIPQEEVYRKYETSCLVFPSYVETFGYPLVEARSVGSIVLASDCNFSHELLDGYENVCFFDPFKAAELYELMKKVATGEIQRQESKLSTETDKDSWEEVIKLLKENLR